MATAGVIVCERTGIWATAIRRRLPGDVRLWQSRGLNECSLQLAAAPACVVAVELSQANLAPALEFVVRWSQRFPRARVVALAEPALAACELPAREAGVIHFFTSPRELSGFERLVANHLERLPGGHASVAESVWETLPWAEAASRGGDPQEG